MSSQNEELEVKFYVSDLVSIEKLVKKTNATLIQPRTYEYNLRFDNPDGDLTRESRIIRLRKDTKNRLTYKGPGDIIDGVSRRQEIEFSVNDFGNAQAFLEALGFQVSMIYEKYRTVYELAGVIVALDEIPYGNFIEIEGPDGSSIKMLCLQLGLRWGARITDSYAGLFQTACKKLDIALDDLVFSNFKDLKVLPIHLGVQRADR